MSASEVMILGVVLLIVAHWASNKPAVSGHMVAEVGFAVLLIAILDHGTTEPVAQGLAWLFLVAVILSKDSPLNALKKIGTAPKTTTTAPKTQLA